MRDVAAAQRVMTELLVDERARAAWRADPRGYARHHLVGAAEREMIVGLDHVGFAWSAGRLAEKGESHDQYEAWRAQRPARPAKARTSPRPSPAPRPATGRPLVGLAYRPRLFRRLLPYLGLIEVWEQMVDHFTDGGEDALDAMATFAGRQPVTLHSLDLSVGSPEARTNDEHLHRIRDLARVAGAKTITDHFGYSRVPGHALPHFAPLWRVKEALDIVAGNVDYIQDAIGIRVALENITLTFDPGGDIGTAEFLNEVARRTGCGVHLDITNLNINGANGFCDPDHELDALDLDNVVSVHLAGGVEGDGQMRDAHSFPVPDDDFARLERLLPHMPNCETIVIERDGREFAVEEVVDDLRRAHGVVARAFGGDADGTTPARGLARAFIERPTDRHVSRRRALLRQPRLPEPAWATASAANLAGQLARAGVAKVSLAGAASNEELLAFAGRLGDVMAVPRHDPLTLQHTEDGFVVDIKPEDGPLLETRTKPLYEDGEVLLHTEHSFTSLDECPAYVALLCVEPPAGDAGGQTVLVSMDEVQRRLTPTQLETLSQTYRAEAPGAPPLVRLHAGRAVFSYGGLEGAHLWCLPAGATAPRFEVESAFRAFLDALYTAPAWGLRCERGEVLIWDNRRWFHGRTKMRPASGPARHVKRVLIRDRSAGPREAEALALSGSIATA